MRQQIYAGFTKTNGACQVINHCLPLQYYFGGDGVSSYCLNGCDYFITKVLLSTVHIHHCTYPQIFFPFDQSSTIYGDGCFVVDRILLNIFTNLTCGLDERPRHSLNLLYSLRLRFFCQTLSPSFNLHQCIATLCHLSALEKLLVNARQSSCH